MRIFVSILLPIFIFCSCQRMADSGQRISDENSNLQVGISQPIEEQVNDVVHNTQDEFQSDRIELPYYSVLNSQVIEHYAYTVSYNFEWLIPNWVAYSLTDDETYGTVPREDSFYPDPLIKGVAIETGEYTHSGYDRGHMAPAADMKWSEQAMYESFYMTNVCPQNRNLNRGDWNDLEELARDWARKYGEIYIVCGPLVSQDYRTIGQNKKIAIPNAFFKVFLRQTDTSWTAIGFVMPNQAGNRPLMTYTLSIDEVEQLSGIDFFYNLPDNMEDDVEKEFSVRDWNINVRRK